jgi:hypothetical protein
MDDDNSDEFAAPERSEWMVSQVRWPGLSRLAAFLGVALVWVLVSLGSLVLALFLAVWLLFGGPLAQLIAAVTYVVLVTWLGYTLSTRLALWARNRDARGELFLAPIPGAVLVQIVNPVQSTVLGAQELTRSTPGSLVARTILQSVLYGLPSAVLIAAVAAGTVYAHRCRPAVPRSVIWAWMSQSGATTAVIGVALTGAGLAVLVLRVFGRPFVPQVIGPATLGDSLVAIGLPISLTGLLFLTVGLASMAVLERRES